MDVVEKYQTVIVDLAIVGGVLVGQVFGVPAFSQEPLIPLALVIGPLLELPLLSVVSQLLLGLEDRYRSSVPTRQVG